MKTPLCILLSFFLFQNLFAQQPLVAISDQMNVIYIGIDNSVTIAVEGFSSNQVEVSSDDLTISRLDDGKYNLIAKRPGKAIINVHPSGKEVQEIIYRVKRVPDPLAKLGYKTGGVIGLENLKFQTRIIAHLEGFDLGKGEIMSFEMTVQYQKDNADPIGIVNQGGKFSPDTKALIETLNVGDTVYFDRILAKSPGDYAARKINSMIFKVR